MLSKSTIVLMAVLLANSACGSHTGVATEMTKACAPENEKKYLEVSGYLSDRGSVFCSNTGGRMDCGFDLLESPGSDKKLRVDIEQGTGANSVDKLASGYKKEDIKIRDSAGNAVALGSDKVRVTGQMSIEPAMNVCFMTVEKIEK